MKYDFNGLRWSVEMADVRVKSISQLLIGRASFAVTANSMKPDHSIVHLSDAAKEYLESLGWNIP